MSNETAEEPKPCQFCGNLLAVVHRDGGQYVREHGIQQACADAERVVADLHTMRAEIDGCQPYLKDGETPAQRIERERRATDAALTLLARERRRTEILNKAIEEAESVLRRSGCDMTADMCRRAMNS